MIQACKYIPPPSGRHAVTLPSDKVSCVSHSFIPFAPSRLQRNMYRLPRPDRPERADGRLDRYTLCNNASSSHPPFVSTPFPKRILIQPSPVQPKQFRKKKKTPHLIPHPYQCRLIHRTKNPRMRYAAMMATMIPTHSPTLSLEYRYASSTAVPRILPSAARSLGYMQ